MIKAVTFGEIIETGAVIASVETAERLPDYLIVTRDEGITIEYTLGKKDAVFGLGEAVRGINKRGFTYISQCMDDPKHTESARSLYSAHNFILVKSEKLFGLFIDCPSEVIFDIAETDCDLLKITVPCGSCKAYIIEEPSMKEIVKKFREIIGQSYLAPKWAFGYQQSRWSYMTSSEVRDVVKQYQENDFPLEVLHLDIDYMDGYKDFKINRETFPDFEKMVSDLKKDGVHTVTIIDAGVKEEEGYDIYDEANEKGYFCKKEDGTNFVAGVWPGRCNFPDFMRKEVRDWFGNHHKLLLDMGIDGFWNDMNEPAIFYSADGFQQIMTFMDGMRNTNAGLQEVFGILQMVEKVSNDPEDYKQFYHIIDNEKVRHDRVHNLYGYYMVKGISETVDNSDDKRVLIFSRSSYIGSHRYGGIWTGDNSSWWNHLLLNLKMMPSLNMCGYLYTGADIGGFGENTTEDLMIRWLQFGMFTPLFRNHSAMGTKNQELYLFKQKDIIRNMLKLHYAFVPYLYSEYMKAAVNSEMMFTPLCFEYPEDEHAYQVEDQLLVGESIMVAPVYEQNATGRYVYLPEDMMCVTFRSVEDRDCKIYEAGHHYISCELNEVIVFIRKNHILPLGKGVSNTEDICYEELDVLAFGSGSYDLYNDDGMTKKIDLEAGVTTIEV